MILCDVDLVLASRRRSACGSACVRSNNWRKCSAPFFAARRTGDGSFTPSRSLFTARRSSSAHRMSMSERKTYMGRPNFPSDDRAAGDLGREHRLNVKTQRRRPRRHACGGEQRACGDEPRPPRGFGGARPPHAADHVIDGVGQLARVGSARHARPPFIDSCKDSSTRRHRDVFPLGAHEAARRRAASDSRRVARASHHRLLRSWCTPRRNIDAVLDDESPPPCSAHQFVAMRRALGANGGARLHERSCGGGRRSGAAA